MRVRSLCAVAVAVLGVTACGGGGDSVTEDQIAETLDLHYEGADYLYDSLAGTCIVMQFLTSADQVSEADTGDATEAVATNPDETAGVVFGGVTSTKPDLCVPYAERDLESLGEGD
jgi:hypothetical protein